MDVMTSRYVISGYGKSAAASRRCWMSVLVIGSKMNVWLDDVTEVT